MASRTRALPVSAADHPAGLSAVVAATLAPLVVAEADDARRLLTVALYAYPVAGAPGGPPVPLPDVHALLLFGADEGAGAPTWRHHTDALVPGDRVSYGAADAPLASLRVVCALAVAPGADVSAYRFEIVAGEHGLSTRC